MRINWSTEPENILDIEKTEDANGLPFDKHSLALKDH